MALCEKQTHKDLARGPVWTRLPNASGECVDGMHQSSVAVRCATARRRMYLPSVFGRAKCDRAARVAAARRGRCRARRAWRRRNGRADARVARRRARLYVTSVSKLRVKANDAARDAVLRRGRVPASSREAMVAASV